MRRGAGRVWRRPLTASGPPAANTPVAAPAWSAGRDAVTRAAPSLLPAVLSATAPAMIGPRAKPRSRSRLVVALAMPARCSGTVLIATAVNELTDNAKPTPMSSAGATIGTRLVSSTSSREASQAPAAIRAKPTVSSHRALTRASSREMTGISRKAGAWMSNSGMPTLAGA